jgi:DNA-binding CsgD family transcriptional regulator
MPSVAPPIVGRDELITEFVAGYADPDAPGALFTGPAGIGKTTLVEAIVARLTAEAPDRAVLRVHASAALTTVPFGALLHIVGASGEAGAVSWPPDPTELFERLRPAGRARLIVAVDDVPQLDAASLGLLVELVAGRHAYVLGTARSTLELPGPAGTLTRAHGWPQRELAPLDSAAIQTMADRALDGPLARGAALRLWERSGGSPLFARELITAALASGAVRPTPEGLWELVAPVSPGSRLSDLVAERVAQTSPDAARLLNLLAVAEPLSAPDVAASGLRAAIDELVADELVEAGPDGLRLAHPLYGDVLAARIGMLERRRLIRQAIDVMAQHSDGEDRAAVRIAQWQLDIGAEPDLDVLVSAARHARRARDMPSAVLLARAALERTGSLEMRRILAEALMHTGHPEEADAVAGEIALPGPSTLDELEVVEHLRLLGVRVYNRLWYLRDPGAARHALDEAAAQWPHGPATELLDIHAAYVLTFEGRAAEALETLEAARPWSPDVAPQGWLSLAQARAVFGLGLEVLQGADEATTALATTPAAELTSDPALFDVVRARGLMFTGRLANARALLDEVLERPAVRANPFPRAAALVTAAEVAFWSGHVATARRAADEAASAADATANSTMRAVAFGHLATAAGQAGDTSAAERLLAVLSSVDLPSPVGSDEVARGIAWAQVALGRPEDARRTLVAAADTSRARGDAWDALWLLVDLARLGAAADVRDPVGELCASMTGALAEALGAFVRALAGRSPEPLAAVTEQLAALGADLFAAEAATALESAYRRAGNGRAADAAAARAAELAARCEGARTPGLVSLDAVVPLTTREREVATLAARGLANAEIAERLGLSARTVGNHLQNAYTKLGVSARTELAARIDTV